MLLIVCLNMWQVFKHMQCLCWEISMKGLDSKTEWWVMSYVWILSCQGKRLMKKEICGSWSHRENSRKSKRDVCNWNRIYKRSLDVKCPDCDKELKAVSLCAQMKKLVRVERQKFKTYYLSIGLTIGGLWQVLMRCAIWSCSLCCCCCCCYC